MTTRAHQTSRTLRRREGDSGFGLVEIVISMFLLALLAVAFLPLLIDALRVSVRNATIATATQLVSEQLDAVTVVPRTCAGVEAFANASLADISDERGTVYTPHRAVSPCPATGYPMTVDVRVWVTVDTDPSVLVESRTTVVVESQN